MRASIEVADIFRAAGPTYRAVHAGHLSLAQLKVMSAIETCRTAIMGGHVEACAVRRVLDHVAERVAPPVISTIDPTSGVISLPIFVLFPFRTVCVG